VIPVFSRRLSMAADVASVQFSRTVERRNAGWSSLMAVTCFDVSPRGPADAGLSKLNSMLGLFSVAHRRPPQVARGARPADIQPGSVDVLGPIRLDTTCLEGGWPQDRGTAWCSLERR
jgi:hypothetical protein